MGGVGSRGCRGPSGDGPGVEWVVSSGLVVGALVGVRGVGGGDLGVLGMGSSSDEAGSRCDRF